MDDLYLDALGITDEVEKLGLKGNKKKKSKKLDEDFMVLLNAFQSEILLTRCLANSQTTRREGCSKSYPGDSANVKSEGAIQTTDSNKGWLSCFSLLHSYRLCFRLRTTCLLSVN